MPSNIFERWRDAQEHRFPKNFIDQRLKLERQKERSVLNGESSTVGKWLNHRTILRNFLRLSGLRSRGACNALNIKIVKNTLFIPSLPKAFFGYKILQISDLHFNNHPGFVDALVKSLRSTTYDLCVLTGDYRFRSFGPMEVALEGLSTVSQTVDRDVVAVLGNHDSIEMVPAMEALGFRVLINEHCVLKRGGARLLIAGVDDPHYYRTDDIDLALRHVMPAERASSILLAHSPEAFINANEAGINAYLCGHTHGGQICWYPGKSLYKNFRSPGFTLAGAWRYHDMVGYTSRGVGTSVANARFNCSPEITVHELLGVSESA